MQFTFLLLLAVANGYAETDREVSGHWSFRPVRPPEPPSVKAVDWAVSAIDRFVLAKLEERGLTPSPRADRRTLIRRASHDLTGLPPSPAEIDAFLNDPSPNAFGTVVDRLLDSPHFGERWARYWLDIARYADTKGYIFTEERKFPYSYTYRDWVVRSFNEDLPYDQFVIQQIAADQLDLDDKRPLAALGFLTLGRRFLGNPHDIIDDRIDVVTRGMMAMTVQCARCHDHKYDPIPQADYYSLYGVFGSSTDKELPIATATPEFELELSKRDAELTEFQESTLARTLHKLRTHVSDYLLAAESLKDHPDIQEFMFVENPGDVNRFALGRWRTYLEVAGRQHHPIWSPWIVMAGVPEAEFGSKAPELARQFSLNANPAQPIHPLVAALFRESPKSIKDVAERYGRLFAEVEQEWQDRLAAAKAGGSNTPAKLDDAAREQIREVLYGPESPTAVPRRRVDDLFEKPDADKLRALRKKVQEWRTSPGAPPNAMALVDNDHPINPAVFIRGNPGNRGPAVPRQFLTVLSGPNRKPFERGSGRLELAQAIATADNPLTARVYANRVWANLFGNGLVRTPSDFGTRSDPPSHPELLDWLAHWFTHHGWSTKELIRMIMLSSVYQQGSGDLGAGQVDRAAAIDPENRLLWRQNRRRLDFESMRDSLLAVTGDLDRTAFGPAIDLATQPFNRRRTVYGFIERQNLPGMLRTFDFASPDTHCPQRFTTTVPQQALFLMNSPFVMEQAKLLAARPDIATQNDPRLRIQRFYRGVFGRLATQQEVELALPYIEQALDAPGESTGSDALSIWERFAQVLLLSNEFMFVD